MAKLDKRYRVSLPKSICEMMDWKVGDELNFKIVNLDLVHKLLSGDINLDNYKMPIIIFNCEGKKDEVKQRRTIFD